MLIRGGSIVLLVALALMTGCPPTPPPPSAPFSQIVVFGDSLSDLRNDKDDLLILPLPPYSDGRFSNGDLYIQHIADHFHLPIAASTRGGTNYAFGGARTGLGRATFDGLPLVPNMFEQLSFYTEKPKGTELFVVWGGGNDIIAILEKGDAITPPQIAGNIAVIVLELYNRGGRYFLVPNFPDAGALPRFLGTDNQARATQLAQEFDAELTRWLDTIDDLPGILVYRADVMGFFKSQLANPPPPLTNTTQPAWTGNFFGTDGTLAADPDSYVFWDTIHPTRISHGLLGEFMIELLEANLPAAAIR